MKDYMDLADDKASLYEKVLIIIVILGIIGGLFVSYSLAQVATYNTNDILNSTVEYQTNFFALMVYSFISIIINVVVGFIMKFFIDMYKEMVMQRFMTHHLLKIFEKAEIK